MRKATRRIYYDLRAHGMLDPCYGEKFMYIGLEVINENPDSLAFISKEIYPVVAKKCRTSPSCVERDMRSFIKKLWDQAGPDYFEKISGKVLEKCPTNTEFLSFIYAYYIKAE